MVDPAHPHAHPTGIPLSADAAKGLIGSLFDLSFKSFVTPKVIQILFILELIVLAVFAIAMIAMGFAQSALAGVLTLLLSPLIFLIGVLIARIYLELVIVLFRIYETLRDRPA